MSMSEFKESSCLFKSLICLYKLPVSFCISRSNCFSLAGIFLYEEPPSLCSNITLIMFLFIWILFSESSRRAFNWAFSAYRYLTLCPFFLSITSFIFSLPSIWSSSWSRYYIFSSSFFWAAVLALLFYAIFLFFSSSAFKRCYSSIWAFFFSVSGSNLVSARLELMITAGVFFSF